MIRVSALAASVLPSATLAAGAKARALRAKGVTVYDFSLGEPDFDTPPHICEAATRAMAAGQTHYTPSAGTPAVRKAVADWYGRTYSYEVGPENVIVSNGAKHSIHNVLAATVGPGDEVVIPTPCWVSYCDLVQMTGATPVLVGTTLESGFKMSPEQLEAAVTPKTRLLMLNSPCNPTGTVYSRAELEALVELFLERSDGAVLSDEIYEALCYGDATPTCVAALRPGWRDRVVTVSGASKGYAMTGWRAGWAVGPADLVKAMDNVQSQETSCPSSVTQAAVVEALTSAESPRCIADMRAEFAARRQLTYDALAAVPGVRFNRGDGAFYAFFEVREFYGRRFGGVTFADSAGFCAACLEQAHVNLVPGSAFGCEGFARMSFATDRASLTAGLDRLKAWLASGE